MLIFQFPSPIIAARFNQLHSPNAATIILILHTAFPALPSTHYNLISNHPRIYY
jgi:hypothetical protein